MVLRLHVPLIFRILLCAVWCLRLGSDSAAHSQTVVHDLFALSVPGPLGLTRIDGRTGAVVYSVPNGGLYAAQGSDGFLYTTAARVEPATGAAISPWRAFPAIGLDFGPDGYLYGASDRTVTKYNPATGGRVSTFVSGVGPNTIGNIEAVRFGPDGHLYLTENVGVAPTGSRVMRYNGTTGAFMGVFASDSRLVQPRSLDWGPNGNLFVAGLGTEYEPGNGSVVEFDGVTGSFVRVIASGLAMPNGLAFGPDGNLYVGLQGIATIKRYHGTTGEYIDDFATGLPSNLIGITWATVAVPEPSGAALFFIGGVATLRLRLPVVSLSRRRRRPQRAVVTPHPLRSA